MLFEVFNGLVNDRAATAYHKISHELPALREAERDVESEVRKRAVFVREIIRIRNSVNRSAHRRIQVTYGSHINAVFHICPIAVVDSRIVFVGFILSDLRETVVVEIDENIVLATAQIDVFFDKLIRNRLCRNVLFRVLYIRVLLPLGKSFCRGFIGKLLVAAAARRHIVIANIALAVAVRVDVVMRFAARLAEMERVIGTVEIATREERGRREHEYGRRNRREFTLLHFEPPSP